MDSNKAWLWRKKSAEKSLRDNDGEVQTLLSEKAKLEKDVKTLEDKLSSIHSDCNNKEELVKNQTIMANETIKGREKAEEEVESLKLQLDEAWKHGRDGEERLSHLDAALKECMQQMRFLRDEQERMIHDAVMKTSWEFEKTQMMLEEKLSETNKRLSKMVNENSHLGKALLLKEKLIDELNRQLNQVEADFGTLMARLEATEKDNTSFKYEVRVLEKELEIRNEEREFNRRTADAAHRQHLENVKSIAKLESECQRLRALVRKRLPGPASLARMRNEVNVPGRNSVDKRIKSNSASLVTDDSMSILTEQLLALEEENKALREVLSKRTNELHSSNNLYACKTYKSSLVESQFDASSKCQSRELSVASVSEIGSDDKASCGESWTSALISELENFRNEKQKGSRLKRGVEAADINLMDDFVEMEKLAVGSVHKPACGSHIPLNDAIPIAVPLDNESSEIKYPVDAKFPVWLQDILKLIWDQNSVTGRSCQDIMEEIRIALDHVEFPKPVAVKVSDKSSQKIRPGLSNYIHKIIELIEGLGIPSLDYDDGENFCGKNGNLSRTNQETPEGYTARVLQWKTSELTAVLQQYLLACYDVVNEKADLERFVQQLTSALEWIIDHCFSLQDVSSMRDAIIKQCDWDDYGSEVEVRIMSRSPRGMDNQREQPPRLSSGSASKGITISLDSESSKKELEGRLQIATETSEELLNKLQESEKVIGTLETELQTLRKEKCMIEDQIEHQKMMNEELDTQLTVTIQELNEARDQFSSLEVELENKNSCFEELQATCVELELQIESGKIPSPDVNHDQEEKQRRTNWEITTATEKLAECQETILNLGKKLKALSTTSTTAPKEASSLNKVITTTTNEGKLVDETTRPAQEGRRLSHRTSLLDRMLADDGAETNKNPKSPETKEIDKNSTAKIEPCGTVEPLEKILVHGRRNGDSDTVAEESMAIAMTKKRRGRALWKKFLWRKKKVNSQNQTANSSTT